MLLPESEDLPCPLSLLLSGLSALCLLPLPVIPADSLVFVSLAFLGRLGHLFFVKIDESVAVVSQTLVS